MKKILNYIGEYLPFLVPAYVLFVFFSWIFLPIIFNSSSREVVVKDLEENSFEPNYNFTLNFLNKPFEQFTDSLLSDEIHFLDSTVESLLDSIENTLFNDTLNLYCLDVKQDSIEVEFLKKYSDRYSPNDEFGYSSQEYLEKYNWNYAKLKLSKMYFFTISEKKRDDFEQKFPNAKKVRMFESEKTVVVKDTLFYLEESNKNTETLKEIFIIKQSFK